jgi:hypothetical protein
MDRSERYSTWHIVETLSRVPTVSGGNRNLHVSPVEFANVTVPVGSDGEGIDGDDARGHLSMPARRAAARAGNPRRSNR